MKAIIIILVLCTSSAAYSQDTLYYSNGTFLATDIVSIQKANNLVIYAANGDTTFAPLSSISSYVLNSTQDSFYTSNGLSIQEEKEVRKVLKQRITERDYGKFSLLVNPTALIPFRHRNSKLHVELDYQISPHFSVSLPIVVGLGAENLKRSNHYSNYHSQDSSPSLFIQAHRGSEEENIIFKTGVNPKFYFFERNNSLFTPYLGLGLNFLYMDNFAYRYYDKAELITTQFSDFWDIRDEQTVVVENPHVAFQYEIQLGIDINLTRRSTVSFVGMYASNKQQNGELLDETYLSVNGSDYELIDASLAKYNRVSNDIIGRIVYVFRF